MQLRDVPITSVEEGSDELDLEAQWIHKNAFSKSSVSNQVKKQLKFNFVQGSFLIPVSNRKGRSRRWKGNGD